MVKFVCFLYLVTCILIQSCAPPVPTPVEATIKPLHISIEEDESSISVSFTKNLSLDQILTVNETLKTIPFKTLEKMINNRFSDDSLAAVMYNRVTKNIPSGVSFYTIDSTVYDHNTISMVYTLNADFVDYIISSIRDKETKSENKIIYPLFTKKHSPPEIDAVSGLNLLLPCKNIPVPKRALLLPNAPRSYRNGIHRGIDFYASWGTPVQAVSHGVVIRADHQFEEVPPEFRKQMLAEAKQLGHTPSDVFEHVLVGRSIYIDHGFDLVPGFRAISIYAHLSHINKDIKPGVSVSPGQLIGLSGNSGTEPSTQGLRKGAHLHWELILQNAGGEYYLGQGLNDDDLYTELTRIFNN
ncbi:MAG: M23 family metallopeptidase [Fidelibacterota bacterium]